MNGEVTHNNSPGDWCNLRKSSSCQTGSVHVHLHVDALVAGLALQWVCLQVQSTHPLPSALPLDEQPLANLSPPSPTVPHLHRHVDYITNLTPLN